MFCFFFFQAEDGIRDLTVTGVQTCALPISSRFRREMVACARTDYCNLAQIDTKGQAAELSRRLDEKLDTVGRAVSLHWSGCPAGCGNHQAADIGFRG